MVRERPTPTPHPVVGELALRRITRRRLAAQLGVAPEWLSTVLNGHERPSLELQTRIAAIVGRPVDGLFRAEVRFGREVFA